MEMARYRALLTAVGRNFLSALAVEDDAMTKLSAKAFRFVDAAVVRSESGDVRSVWNSFKIGQTQELSDEAAQVVLHVLEQAEGNLCRRLKSTSVSEDEAADTSNDLGFIHAVKHDLESRVVSCGHC
jgi:hypothetical protein